MSATDVSLFRRTSLRASGASLLGSYRLTTGLSAGVFALLAACSSDGTDTPPATGALTTGRVEAEGGASAEVSVRAYELRADGSMSAASEPATTDASGRYVLDVDVSEAATAIIVRVEDGTERMNVLSRAAVDVAASGEGTIEMGPIDATSTVSAEVAVAIEERAELREAAFTSLYFTAQVAAEVEAAADHDAAIDAAADAVIEAHAALEAGLSADVASDVGASTTGDVSLATSAMADLDAQLMTALDASASATARTEAWRTHFEAAIDAMVEAGFDHEQLVVATLSASSALTERLEARLGEDRAALHTFAAFVVAAAVDARAEAAFGASAVSTASATLRADVMAMAEAGASAEDLGEAWATYEAAVSAELMARLSLTAMLLSELTTALEASAATLRTALSAAAANGQARAEAYAAFWSSVHASANLDLLVTGGLTAEQAEAALDAMASIEAAAAR